MLRDQELVDLDPDSILRLGQRELLREQQVFAQTARLIDPTKSPIEVFRAIQKDHPTAANLIADTRQHLEAIREFMTNHHLITLPAAPPPRVDETPEFARATSFASMDAPGPFETKATEAYYYSAQRFHDELLHHGQPPIRLLRQWMLKDPAAWNDIL